MTYNDKEKIQTAAAGQYTGERDYWLQKLSGEPAKTFFPYDSAAAGAGEKRPGKITFYLGEPVYAHLVRISNTSDVRLHIILVAGWLMLLHRYTSSSDIIVGVPAYKQDEDVEGELINSVLALRGRVTGEMTIKELLLQVGETILEASENQNYPIDTLVYKLNLPASGGDFPLFDISILLEGIHDKSYLAHIRQNMVVSFRQREAPAAIEGIVEYNAGVYREDTMRRIVSHFQQLLANALPDVSIPISRVEILSGQERKQLLKDFNDNAVDFPRDKTVCHFIEDHVQKRPGAVAVSCGGEDITYEQLNRRAGRLALALREKGVETETIAAIVMERSIEMVVSILAVWKAGGAYLPIDPAYPQERIDYILENSGAVILTASDLSNEMKCVAAPAPAPCNLHLSYIIYTSGSTGQPKGAMVEHVGMMNHIQAKIDTLQVTEKSIIAQNASHTFDISVWQFFTALVRGGKTVIYPDSLILDPLEFTGRICEDRVTILEVVPSYLSIMLDAILTREAVSMPLEYLLVTGEEIKAPLVARWFDMYPHIKMVNAYGPTEVSDDITHHVMDGPPQSERVPIGKPVRNLDIYIVDRCHRLCPIGVDGEIWVSGVGVGRGYLKDDERTRRAFMEDPFAEEPGVRLYKTGDLGRWLPDGTIEFLGRIDHQVKIRGFRIELGEIENRLSGHPGVQEAVVIDREDPKGNKFLCAYIVGAGVAGLDLKEYLSRSLPDYMVPAHFVKMDRLPLTPNGKIDRKALLESGLPSDGASAVPYISREMLNRLAVGLEMGRDSMRTASEAEREQILYRFNDTHAEFPHDKTLYQLLEEQVEKKPDKIAVVGESMGTHDGYDLSLSYRHLSRRANRLARSLQAGGIGAGSIVGIMIEPSPEFLIGILAIMKAGGAYLAVEVTYPDKRIDYLCRDSGMQLILTGKSRRLPDRAAMTVDLADENLYRGEVSNLPSVNTSLDPAAIFYTSGSTGKPKGVLVLHRGLVNRLWWLQQCYPLEENDVILQKTPIIFDVSVGELFGWCPAGASLYFVPPRKGNKPEHIIDAVQKGKVTHVHIPPAFQLPVLHYLEDSGRLKDLRRLKRVYASGEALLPTHVNEFNRLLYRGFGTRLIDLYGPTEASIEVSYYDCSSDRPLEKVPIGKPIHNIRLYIVNEDLELVPVGVPGQLCISGVGLAGGYLNRPGLTAEAFVKNTYQPGERMYLTGDLAQWLPDGNIEFLGRIDNQVQLDGMRVELGEIESFLLKHKDIKEAAVVPRQDEIKGRQYLCAFATGVGPLEQSDYKKVLARELPHFMMPGRFVELDRMPMTPSGKIDRKILQKIEPFSRTGIKNITAALIKQVELSGEKEKNGLHLDEGSPREEVVLSEQEKHKILYLFNATEMEFPRDKTIHRLFEEQAARRPDGKAVTGYSAGGLHTVSYGELNKRANRLARLLRVRGVTADTIAGIMTVRTVEMIAAMMAILKAGGAYLAIALTYPDNRIGFMCRDSRMPLLLTDNNRPLSLPGPAPLTIDIDNEENYRQDDNNLPMVQTAGDAAAVFYTSGSTGIPKGTILEHRGLVNRMHWMHRRYPIDETDVILQKTAVVFDVSIWELFWWSFYGASVYLLPPDKGDHPQDIAAAVGKGNVTRMHFIPTPMVSFLHHLEIAEGGGDGTKAVTALASLKSVFASGEALPPLLVNRFNRLLYRGGITRLYNLYGPTEASIDVSYFDCPGDSSVDGVPIGKPIDNIQLYIVDRNLELLPIGAVGELCISGVGLARGYLNRPELTADKFLTAKTREETRRGTAHPADTPHPSPFTLHPSPLYKTGDLARWLEDGNIEFLGRIDHQMQINGMRIELGEIESALLKHKRIAEAVVVARTDEKDGPYLCAFVKAAGDLGRANLREFLAGDLPLYTIPARFVELEHIPLTPTGKVNRKVLEIIDLNIGTPTEYAAPKTEKENLIADIWKKVLNTDRVGIHDNFFDIGGNSLGIIQVNVKLKELFKRDIPALIMFEYPTIASIIGYLEKNPGDSTEPVREYEEKERSEAKGKGRDRMQQRKDKLKKVRKR